MDNRRSLPPKTNLSATAYGPRRRELLIAAVMLGLIIGAGVLIFIMRHSTPAIALIGGLTLILEVALGYFAFYRQMSYWPLEKWLLQSIRWRKRGRKWVRGGAYADPARAVRPQRTVSEEPRPVPSSQGGLLQALLRLSPAMITVGILGTWTLVLVWIGEDGIREAEFTLKGILGGW
ncbi:MAG: hypothetical protein DWQ07_17855 [Chloroflexi bacterium]|nr:MAG: hypothetical protein DWQ07_17855 [Chloroflexota bacterium]